MVAGSVSFVEQSHGFFTVVLLEPLDVPDPLVPLLDDPLEDCEKPGGHGTFSLWPSEYVATHSLGVVSALRPTFEPQSAAFVLHDSPPEPVGSRVMEIITGRTT